MSIEIRMPKFGETMEEGMIVAWKKQVGLAAFDPVWNEIYCMCAATALKQHDHKKIMLMRIINRMRSPQLMK